MANGNGSNGNGSRLVTWPQLITSLGVLGALGGGIQTFVWAQHSAHPHPGAVTHQEQKQFERRFEDSAERQKTDVQRIERKVDALDGKLDAVLQEVRKR